MSATENLILGGGPGRAPLQKIYVSPLLKMHRLPPQRSTLLKIHAPSPRLPLLSGFLPPTSPQPPSHLLLAFSLPPLPSRRCGDLGARGRGRAWQWGDEAAGSVAAMVAAVLLSVACVQSGRPIWGDGSGEEPAAAVKAVVGARHRRGRLRW